MQKVAIHYSFMCKENNAKEHMEREGDFRLVECFSKNFDKKHSDEKNRQIPVYYKLNHLISV